MKHPASYLHQHNDIHMYVFEFWMCNDAKKVAERIHMTSLSSS